MSRGHGSGGPIGSGCAMLSDVTKNWAGNHEYAAARIHTPGSVAELQDLVAGADRIRALGTRHSFTDVADSAGDLVSTADLPADIELDSDRGRVRVAAGVRYGDL